MTRRGRKKSRGGGGRRRGEDRGRRGGGGGGGGSSLLAPAGRPGPLLGLVFPSPQTMETGVDIPPASAHGVLVQRDRTGNQAGHPAPTCTTLWLRWRLGSGSGKGISRPTTFPLKDLKTKFKKYEVLSTVCSAQETGREHEWRSADLHLSPLDRGQQGRPPRYRGLRRDREWHDQGGASVAIDKVVDAKRN